MLVGEGDYLGRRGSSPREETGRCFQDLVRPAQLPHLTLVVLDPLRFGGAHPGAAAIVDLSLADPAAQGLGPHAQLASHPGESPRSSGRPRRRSSRAPCARLAHAARAGTASLLGASCWTLSLAPSFQAMESPADPGRFRSRCQLLCGGPGRRRCTEGARWAESFEGVSDVITLAHDRATEELCAAALHHIESGLASHVIRSWSRTAAPRRWRRSARSPAGCPTGT